MNSIKSPQGQGEYAHVAVFYDRMMAHVNYKAWSGWLKRSFDLARRNVRDVLDVSCGTGIHAALLNGYGFRCFAADLSFAMLRRAGKRPALSGRLWQQDARHVAVKPESFDAVVMLFDSINYLTEKKDILAALRQMEYVLRPGGVFVFDTVTEYMIVTLMTDYYETNTWDDVAYERHSNYDAENKLQYNRFSVLKDGRMYKECHRQRIWSHREMLDFIAQTSLEVEDVRADFTYKNIGPKTERIHYVVMKR